MPKRSELYEQVLNQERELRAKLDAADKAFATALRRCEKLENACVLYTKAVERRDTENLTLRKRIEKAHVIIKGCIDRDEYYEGPEYDSMIQWLADDDATNEPQTKVPNG